MLVGREWTMSDLIEQTRDAKQGKEALLKTIRGPIKISVVEKGGGEIRYVNCRSIFR